MSSIAHRFIEPLDVLFLRGNQLFGDPGSFGESLVPPWPSVAAGAIRSRMLADERIDLAAFARGEIEHPSLGSPEAPGSFTLAAFHLARRIDGRTEILLSPPADLVIGKDEAGALTVQRLTPTAVGEASPGGASSAVASSAVTSSFPLPWLPVLAQPERCKAESGWWLTQAGWQACLAGQVPATGQLVHSSTLWSLEARIGVGMEAATRSAADGKLFSAQAVSLRAGVGFLAAVTGAEPPVEGLLRLGGDGRAAAVSVADINLPEPDYEAVAHAGRCRLILTAPGIFPQGWMPACADAENRIVLGDIAARLVSAVVPRCETVSGWDLAHGHPKAAQRVVPAGSVYWLDDMKATPDSLRKLVASGLWSTGCGDASRRAEGFNRVAVAAW